MTKATKPILERGREPMTPREQKNLIREYLDSIRGTVFDAIDAGKVVEWDGVEFREYLAELTDRARATFIRQPGHERRRQYQNYVLIKNL